MDHRIVLAVVLISTSAVFATADGVYLHLYKYRLFARADSRTEHWTHSIRALMFGPIVYLLFAHPYAGVVLWATLGLVVVDFGVQSWDVLVERGSRATLGGLTPVEYWIHVAAITTHVAAVTLILVTRPDGAWSLSAGTVAPGPWPSLAHWTALAIAPGAVGLGVLHLGLMHPRFRRGPDAGAAA